MPRRTVLDSLLLHAAAEAGHPALAVEDQHLGRPVVEQRVDRRFDSLELAGAVLVGVGERLEPGRGAVELGTGVVGRGGGMGRA